MDKVIAKDFRELKEVKLPTSGITLKLYPSLLVGDVIDSGADTSNLNETENALKILTKVIKEWNFYGTAEDKDPLPITAENLKKLVVPDFIALTGELQKLILAEKKS